MSMTQKSATPYRAGLMAAGDKGKLNKLEILSDGSIESQVPLKLASDPSQLNDAATVSFTNRTVGISAIAGQKPTLDLNFADMADPLAPYGVNWPAAINFSRASTASRINAAGLIEEVPIDTPRIDYDPATGEVKGLSIEQQATNFNLYSEDFANGHYSNVGNSVISSNTHLSPRNDLTADTISASATFSGLKTSNPITVGGNATITSSVFVKKLSSGVRFRVRHQFSGGTNPDNRVIVDLDTMTIVGESVAGSTTIQKYGGGWHRITMQQTENGSASALRVEMISETIGDFLLFGAQLEAGSYATSYIPTSASQMTRASETCNLVNAAIFKNDGYSIFFEAENLSRINNYFNQLLLIENAASTDYLSIRAGASPMHVSIYQGDTEQMTTQGGDYQQVNKVAIGLSKNDFSLSFNKNAPVTSANFQPPQGLSELYFGYNPAYGRQLIGVIKRIAIWNTKIANEKLQELTK